jgi:DNA-directed RNA polymerase specialized sigma24 family protein
MTDYLVRWKFRPGILNKSDVDTSWYNQFHTTKERALNHYFSYLQGSPPVYELVIEMYELVQIDPNEKEPEETVEEIEAMTVEELVESMPEDSLEKRNAKMVQMYLADYTYREIATAMDLSYQTVYGVIRKFKQ